MSAAFPNDVIDFSADLGYTPDAGLVLPTDVVQQTIDEIEAIETFLRAGWTSVAFSAGNFTANGAQTFTVGSGDQLAYAYRLLDPFSMMLTFALTQTSVGGTPNTDLRIAIPAGKICSVQANGTFKYMDNGADGTGYIQADATTGYIRLLKASFANWSASTNNTDLRGQIIIPVG